MLPVNYKWGFAKSFEEFSKLNIEFLEGKHYSTPWHGGPIENETFDVLNEMKKLNSLGFITASSQPGKIEYDYTQNAYVEGLVSIEAAKKLETLSNNYPSIAITWLPSRNRKAIKPSSGSAWRKFDSIPRYSTVFGPIWRTPSNRKFLMSTASILIDDQEEASNKMWDLIIETLRS
jgi:hypothetical protein